MASARLECLALDCDDLTSSIEVVDTSDFRPTAIDLFSGVGGLSYGFKCAGFEILEAVESDTMTAETYRRNHPSTHLIKAPIETIDPSDCLHRLRSHQQDLTVLMGGPPCQGFSESNRRTRTLENPRNHLYQHILRFARVLQPAWILIENVAGLRTMASGAMLRKILDELACAGYNSDCFELNSASFGVPQMRRRLFIIANRVGFALPNLVATHGEGILPYITVEQAVSDLPILENGAREDRLMYQRSSPLSSFQKAMRQHDQSTPWVTGNIVTRNAPFVVERYTHIPQGGNWKDIPIELLGNYQDFSRCHTGIYHRLWLNAPAKVIGNFRKNMLIHPVQDRGLSVREAARLQSFPDHYVFTGSIESQQQQVADAVPPLLAEAVARAVLTASSAYGATQGTFSGN
jgi:DNA (cytosine-5)-methyltransferase 1